MHAGQTMSNKKLDNVIANNESITHTVLLTKRLKV